jgi:hypothetical protein
MEAQPTQDEINRWHRRFAAECNNRTWDLIAQSQRTPAENREMLSSAYASALHWSKVGTPLNEARANITLAHAHALLGHADLALQYARQALNFFETNECEDWDIAFAHAEMALAAAVGGDATLHSTHYAAAQARGAAIQNEEDRNAFMAELARIPREVATRQNH